MLPSNAEDAAFSTPHSCLTTPCPTHCSPAHANLCPIRMHRLILGLTQSKKCVFKLLLSVLPLLKLPPIPCHRYGDPDLDVMETEEGQEDFSSSGPGPGAGEVSAAAEGAPAFTLPAAATTHMQRVYSYAEARLGRFKGPVRAEAVAGAPEQSGDQLTN